MRIIAGPNNGGHPDFGYFFYDWQIYLCFVALLFAIIVITIASIINIVVYKKSKGTKSRVLQSDLFYYLVEKTGYNDLKLLYGKKFIKNNHFNYRPLERELHLSKWYKETNTMKGSMLMLYNFTNILDIQKQQVNFWSRSIYCHIFGGFGLVLNLCAYFAFRFTNYGAIKIMNLNWVYMAMAIMGTIFLLVAWIWWNKIYKKMIKQLNELMQGAFPENEITKMKKLFKLQSVIPFTINTSLIAKRKLDKNDFSTNEEQKNQ